MRRLDEPDNEVYRLAKSGTFALLRAVDAADTEGTAAKALARQPCDVVRAYLDASFLGPFLRGGKQIPYVENAGRLGTYINFLEHELARGATHATPLHQTYLKLLAYLTAVEAAVPLSLFGNCVEFLAGSRKHFEFEIYDKLPSANTKLGEMSKSLKGAGAVPAPFTELYEGLRKLIDRVFRNAIAHASYRIHSDHRRVDIWNRSELVQSRTFDEVDQVYRDAHCYLHGFMIGVSDFAREIHSECPYVWHP